MLLLLPSRPASLLLLSPLTELLRMLLLSLLLMLLWSGPGLPTPLPLPLLEMLLLLLDEGDSGWPPMRIDGPSAATNKWPLAARPAPGPE